MVFQREKLRGHSASFALASVQQLTAFRVSRFARAAVSWIIKKSKLKGINFGDGGAAPRKSRLWRSTRESFQKKENLVRGRTVLSRRTRALLEIDGVVARVFFFFFYSSTGCGLHIFEKNARRRCDWILAFAQGIVTHFRNEGLNSSWRQPREQRDANLSTFQTVLTSSKRNPVTIHLSPFWSAKSLILQSCIRLF